ncbi:hypothetical protein AX15_006899 [Amanita polypyramis BW_CC]|nr:hypothetical protein AX15_006899 [Amanita polypyramis BW_CC]
MAVVVLLTLCLSLSLTLARRSTATKVAIPAVAPSDALSLSPTLLSLSIEQDRWTNWTGTTSRNTFIYNLLDNIQHISGSLPLVRIGANSEDRTVFDPTVQYSTAIFPAHTPDTPYPEATNITVSDAYYQTAQFLPANTHVIWGVNLAQNNISAAFLEAQSIAKAFSTRAFTQAGLVLDAIEIGNEPDLYAHSGVRPGYSLSNYIADWSSFAPRVADAAQITKNSHTKYWIGAFAHSSHSDTDFSPQALLGSGGISNSSLIDLVSTYSQHHYSGSFCRGTNGILQDLMLKENIRGNLSGYRPDIAATRAHGLDYVLGETNSYACHGAPGVSNTAGAALWTLDYSLFAASIGVSRLFFHHGVGFKYNLIQPVSLARSTINGEPLPTPLPAYIQPPYYASIILAEAIGSSGNVQVYEIEIADPYIAGYAFYENGALVRALFINSLAFLEGNGHRQSTHLRLCVGGGGYPSTFVKRLAIGYANDTSGLTWGGQSYETGNGSVSGQTQVEERLVSAGLDIQATEAVLLRFVQP